MKQRKIIIMALVGLALLLQCCVISNGGTNKVSTLPANTLITVTETQLITRTAQPSPILTTTAVITKGTETSEGATITPQPILSLAILKSISPGDYLVYTYDQGFEISSTSGENRQFLAPIMDDWTVLSPDKQFIAYSIRGVPYLYDIKNNREMKLIYSGGVCIMPEWSPDSQKVAFSCHMNEVDGYDLVIFFTADLSHQVIVDCKVTMNFCQMPKWSSDGNKIAYIRKPAYSGESVSTGLYILDTECISKKNCGTGYGPFPFMAAYAWSPDSNLLAGISHSELFIYKFDKGKLSVIYSLGNLGANIGMAETIVWSPDGKFLGISPVIGKAYIYSLDNKQLGQLKLPPNSRLRGWIRFP